MSFAGFLRQNLLMGKDFKCLNFAYLFGAAYEDFIEDIDRLLNEMVGE